MRKFKVGFKKLHKDAIIPKTATKGDAGMDITSVMDDFVLESGEYKLVKTGLAIELEENSEAQVRARSGLALKHGITVLNGVGTIDEGYKGEIGVILINHSKVPFTVEKGMRIAQLVIKPVYEVETTEIEILSESERGEGGFGHSGLK